MPTLTATYRLQLHKEFRFEHVVEIAPYLARLGVSHAYTSPILAARPGSTHGYDVTDPSRANPELGGEDGRRAMAAALERHGLGHVLDIVPNHMGVGPANPYWEDVLRHGRASRWAHWFDIDWSAPGRELRGRVMVPVLGGELDEVLERGELSVDREGSEYRLRYFETTFPLAPETTADLPTEGGGLEAWGRGSVGRSRLRSLLERQHYVLAYWRRAGREINYRRFFDIHELAALRVEDPSVFDAVHARVLEWVADGSLDGLRIDHVDGLRDPLGYLERLRAEVEARRPERREPGGRFPILVEKILSPGERLREEWPVEGTTGYEFLNDLETIFVHPEGYAAIDRGYVRLSRMPGHAAGFHEVAYQGKLKIVRGPLRADVGRLVRLILPLVAATRRGRADVSPAAVANALEELIGRLPVYRSYVDGRRGATHRDDRRVVDAAVERVLAHRAAPRALVELLRGVMLREGWRELSEAERARRLEFTQRFQQTSGPATAKGVEDTALYQYVPLVSLNEVGGEPARPLGEAVETLHRANAERAARWPRALVATNTHDTKRSADVRARLDVLAEMPDEWLAAVARWRRRNAPHRGRAGRRVAPDANTEYLLYQTMVGVWPLTPPAGEALETLRERVEGYMLKAVREGKVRSTWTESDERFEGALHAFIGALMDPERSRSWLDALQVLVARVARPGLWNSLARLAVHLTAPGVADVYQGNELWNFSLVDPDNRRPVDYAGRAQLLGQLDAAAGPDGAPPEALLREMVEAPEDGRIKLWVTSRLLRLRHARPALFVGGGYEPLAARGSGRRHVFAFARTGREGEGPSITIAPRLPLTLAGGAAPVGAAVWGDTLLPARVGPVRQWRCALSGRAVTAQTIGGSRVIPLAEALGALPVAVLVPAK